MALSKVGKNQVDQSASLTVDSDLTVDTNTLYVDSTNNRVGVGTASPTASLTVGAADNEGTLRIGDNGTYFGEIKRINASDELRIGHYGGSQNLTFHTVNAERMRLDSSGNVGIGLSSNISSKLHVNTEMSIGADGDNRGIIGYTPSRFYIGTRQSGTNYFDTFNVSSGYVLFGGTSTTQDDHAHFESNGVLAIRRASGNGRSGIAFNNGSTNCGNIILNTSSTQYNTSSDYRLKTAVTYDWDATTRLKQLRPARFEWIADGDDAVPVDGFLAHEVQSVVPEAITGTHNEVDDEGNPVYQGIDQSKLVPLLVKTIQELEARIAALEAN